MNTEEVIWFNSIELFLESLWHHYPALCVVFLALSMSGGIITVNKNND